MAVVVRQQYVINQVLREQDCRFSITTWTKSFLARKRQELSSACIKEDIRLIALWYTDDVENAARLARINNKSIAQGLKAGEQFAIPSYLVKHQEIMKEAAAKTLSALLEYVAQGKSNSH